MRSRSNRWLVRVMADMAVAGILSTAGMTAGQGHRKDRWLATWATSPQPDSSPIQITGQTLRQIVHTSVGGARARPVVQRVWDERLVIASAHVALSAGDASIHPGTDRVLRFGGSRTIMVPAGGVVVSDAVTLDVPALGDLAVSLCADDLLPRQRAAKQLQQSFRRPATSPSQPRSRIPPVAPLLAGLWKFGSSNKGRRCGLATPNRGIRIRRQTRISAGPICSRTDCSRDAAPGVSRCSMQASAAIASCTTWWARAPSRVSTAMCWCRPARSTSSSCRATSTCTCQTWLIPTQNVTAAQIIQGHQQIITRARAMGMRVYGGTLNPVDGFPFPGLLDAGHGAETAGGQSVDPDERCVQRRDRFRCGAAGPGAAIAPATRVQDSGDHVHPNDLGYRALASAIDLSLFREDDEDD